MKKNLSKKMLNDLSISGKLMLARSRRATNFFVYFDRMYRITHNTHTYIYERKKEKKSISEREKKEEERIVRD
jgi:hypothetical protein